MIPTVFRRPRLAVCRVRYSETDAEQETGFVIPRQTVCAAPARVTNLRKNGHVPIVKPQTAGGGYPHSQWLPEVAERKNWEQYSRWAARYYAGRVGHSNSPEPKTRRDKRLPCGRAPEVIFAEQRKFPGIAPLAVIGQDGHSAGRVPEKVCIPDPAV